MLAKKLRKTDFWRHEPRVGEEAVRVSPQCGKRPLGVSHVLVETGLGAEDESIGGSDEASRHGKGTYRLGILTTGRVGQGEVEPSESALTNIRT